MPETLDELCSKMKKAFNTITRKSPDSFISMYASKCAGHWETKKFRRILAKLFDDAHQERELEEVSRKRRRAEKKAEEEGNLNGVLLSELGTKNYRVKIQEKIRDRENCEIDVCRMSHLGVMLTVMVNISKSQAEIATDQEEYEGIEDNGDIEDEEVEEEQEEGVDEVKDTYETWSSVRNLLFKWMHKAVSYLIVSLSLYIFLFLEM